MYNSHYERKIKLNLSLIKGLLLKEMSEEIVAPENAEPLDFNHPYNPEWVELVAESHKYPLGTDEEIQSWVENLNTKTSETDHEFHILQVVDGVASPIIRAKDMPDAFIGPVGFAKTGPVVQEMLYRLPASLRTGKDKNYEVKQIRLNHIGSFEEAVGATTLLMFFIKCNYENEQCYLVADDEKSHQNWEVFQNMYNEHFPQIPTTTK